MLATLKQFLEERTGLSTFRDETLDAVLPDGAQWTLAIGAALLWLFVLEFVTGLALATVYAPSVQTAWASVFFIQHHFRWGPVVRGVHFWAAQTILIVMALHLVLVIVGGRYRKPRELNWLAGLMLFGVGFMFAHTGSLLPWDQAAYWTTQVEASIAGTVPVVGPPSQRFIQGGRDLGTLSLTRLYVLHIGLLPLAFVFVMYAHMRWTRRFRAPAASGSVASERAWPDQTIRNIVLTLVLFVMIIAVAKKFGTPLDAPADPQSDYPARPEWYLLGLFKLRKLFHGNAEMIATLLIPGLITGFFALLPWIDRSKREGIVPRIPVIAVSLIIGGAVGGYTAYAWRHDQHDAAYMRARHKADQRAARAVALCMNGIPPEGPLEIVRNDPLVRPGELFAEHCGTCHAPSGRPAFDRNGHRTNARGPVLDGFGSRAWVVAMLNDPQANDLFHRTPIDDMPPQSTRPGIDVPALAEYLYAQSVEAGDPPANPELAHRGDELFHNKCTSCHQGAGDLTETDASDRDAPDLTGWGSRAWLRDQILHPDAPTHYGDRNHMPLFGDRLQGRELEWVVDYVRGLRAARAPVVPPAPPHDEASRATGVIHGG